MSPSHPRFRDRYRGSSRATRTALLLALLLCLTLARSASAQTQGDAASTPLGTASQQLPAYLQHAGIQQHLNGTLPLASLYTDEAGLTAPLSHWMGGRPAIIALVYYRCAMMCPQVLHGLATGLHDTTLTPGKDYDVLVFSIDPQDRPADGAQQRSTFLATLNRPGAAAATHFLTASPASIAAIAQATGFNYVRVPGPDGKLDQFAHSSVIMFATPDGRLSKYLSGIDYSARDLRLALLDASEKHISSPVDLFLLYCCSYNPTVGRYSVAVLRVLSVAAAITLVLVVAMVWLLTRRPRQSQAT